MSLLTIISLITIFSAKISHQYCKNTTDVLEKRFECNYINDLKRPEIANQTNVSVKLTLDKYNTDNFNQLGSDYYLENVKELEVWDSINNNLNSDIFGKFQWLKTLTFQDNHISVIGGNVLNFQQLTRLELINNKIEKIARCAFCNMPTLWSIILDNNEIAEIYSEMFTCLPLDILVLSNNKIHKIHKEAFIELPQLSSVDLSFNQLTEFNAKEYFINTTQMLELYLNSNQLKNITKDTFFGWSRLRTVNLAYNNIEYIQDNSFAHFMELRMLNMSHNYIKFINGEVFPSGGIPSSPLYFYLDHNRLNFLPIKLLERIFITRVFFTFGGNPWTCPCLEEMRKWFTGHDNIILCEKEYFKGKIPVCVISKTYYCSNTYDPEYYELFQKGFSEDLEPKCF